MTPLEQAYQIFQQRAAEKQLTYFSDQVKENLQTKLSNGQSPEQAVDNLIKEAEQFHSNR